MYNYVIRTKRQVEDRTIGNGVIVVEFLHDYLANFQMYSKFIFNIFKNVYQEEIDSQGFCPYEFVKILTEIMQIILRNLFHFSCDLQKKTLAKSILKRPIDVRSNVLESVRLIRKDIDQICALVEIKND